MFVINPDKDEYKTEYDYEDVPTEESGGNSVPWGMVVINRTIKDLLKTYDWVVFTDADEYLIVKGTDLRVFLAYRRENMFTCQGYDVLQLDDEASLDLTKPILRQRSKWVINNAYCKTNIFQTPVILGDGAHYTDKMLLESQSKGLDLAIMCRDYADKQLFLLHLKRADRDLFIKKGSRLGENYWNKKLEDKEDIPNWIKGRL